MDHWPRYTSSKVRTSIGLSVTSSSPLLQPPAARGWVSASVELGWVAGLFLNSYSVVHASLLSAAQRQRRHHWHPCSCQHSLRQSMISAPAGPWRPLLCGPPPSLAPTPPAVLPSAPPKAPRAPPSSQVELVRESPVGKRRRSRCMSESSWLPDRLSSCTCGGGGGGGCPGSGKSAAKWEVSQAPPGPEEEQQASGNGAFHRNSNPAPHPTSHCCRQQPADLCTASNPLTHQTPANHHHSHPPPTASRCTPARACSAARF